MIIWSMPLCVKFLDDFPTSYPFSGKLTWNFRTALIYDEIKIWGVVTSTMIKSIITLKTQKKINKRNIKNDFEIISVLRNLKIIGIFKRLAIRDKKKKYLKLIPNAWNLIKLRSKNNDKFKNLNDLLGTIKKN